MRSGPAGQPRSSGGASFARLGLSASFVRYREPSPPKTRSSAGLAGVEFAAATAASGPKSSE